MPFDKKIVGENAKQTYDSLDNYAQYMKLCNLSATSNLSANNLAAVLYVNPQAVEAGTLAYWNKRGQSIRQGEKGIPILKPYGNHMECGYAFDLSQTQPSARTISEGRTQYERKHPFDDTRANEFLDIWKQAVTDVRVIPSNGLSGKSQLQGAAIYVNSDMPPHEQARETLNQYFRYQFAKTLNKSQTETSQLEVEMNAAAAAYIIGKKLGFTMPEPHTMVKPPGNFSCAKIKNKENAMSFVVGQARKLYNTIGQETNRQFLQQKEKTLALGKRM